MLTVGWDSVGALGNRGGREAITMWWSNAGLLLDDFVVAYPFFPGGEWATWDPCIPMDGIFITSWLGDPGLQHLRGSQTPDVHSSSVYFQWAQTKCRAFLLNINYLKSVAPNIHQCCIVIHPCCIQCWPCHGSYPCHSSPCTISYNYCTFS